VISNFARGLQFTLRGFGTINQPGLRRYVVIPLLINLVLISLGTYYLAREFETLMQHLLPDWLSWLQWLLWPLFVLTLALAVFYLFTLVANVVAAPFNAFLAEAIEARRRGTPPPTDYSLKGMLRMGWIGIKASLQMLVYQLVRAIPLLIISLIPVVNVISPLLWFLFAAWVLPQQYLTYPAGNHGLDFRAQQARQKGHEKDMLGLGTGLAAMTMIPVLNFISIPVGVAAATLLWVERMPAEAGSD
jgi:CysZ protein